MTWSRRFEDPVTLPDGRRLVTLREAADYIAKLPPADHEAAHWQTATLALIMAAEDRGPLMHARIGVLRALNHWRPAPAKQPRRKAAKAFKIVR